MNKNDLVAHVSSTAGITKGDAGKAVDAVFAGIKDALKKGEEVRIPDVGSFVVTQRAASEGRNPRTGEKIAIKASKQVKFRPGKGMKDHVNGTVAKAASAPKKK